MAYNQLTDAESERLSLLAEECAEVIQIIMKIQRHGYESFNPVTSGLSNRLELAREIGHVLAALDLMVDRDDVNKHAITRSNFDKAYNVKKWLHHQMGGS